MNQPQLQPQMQKQSKRRACMDAGTWCEPEHSSAVRNWHLCSSGSHQCGSHPLSRPCHHGHGHAGAFIIHSFTLSLTHSLTHALTHSFVCSFACSFIHSSIHSFIHLILHGHRGQPGPRDHQWQHCDEGMSILIGVTED